MEKIEVYSLEALETAKAEATKAGYQETQSITNVPVGSCTAEIVLKTVAKKKVPIFSLIKFTRDEKDGDNKPTGKKLNLMFEAVRLDVLHTSTGKSYNGIDAKVTPELKTALSKPENYTKELVFESQDYKGRTFLKFESMSK